jgi:hypothetical protein
MDGGQGAPATAAPAAAGTPVTVRVKFYLDNKGIITNITSDNPNVVIEPKDLGTGQITFTVENFTSLTNVVAGAIKNGTIKELTSVENERNFSQPTGLAIKAGTPENRYMLPSARVSGTQVKLPLVLSNVGNTFKISGIAQGSGSMNVLGSGTASATAGRPVTARATAPPTTTVAPSTTIPTPNAQFRFTFA